MKKKKDYTIELIVFIFIIAILCSCSSTKIITGPVTAVNGDTATVNGQRFKLYDSIPAVGTQATFKETKNKKKVNSKKI